MLEKLEVTLIGEAPLIMHNGQLADPCNEWKRRLSERTSKRNKTDAELEEIRRIEWMGGLYRNFDGRIAIPADNVLGCLIEGAKKFKLGKKAKAGIVEAEAYYPLIYTGPRDLEKLYQTSGFVDYRMVRVPPRTGARAPRARPRFPEWSVQIQLLVNTDVMNITQVIDSLRAGGELEGLCDYRPRFGRFRVEES